MDNRERRELSENMRSISNSMPRTYVERGVNRRETARRQYDDRGNAYESTPMSEYRRERERAQARANRPDNAAAYNGMNAPGRDTRANRPDSAAAYNGMNAPGHDTRANRPDNAAGYNGMNPPARDTRANRPDSAAAYNGMNAPGRDTRANRPDSAAAYNGMNAPGSDTRANRPDSAAAHNGMSAPGRDLNEKTSDSAIDGENAGENVRGSASRRFRTRSARPQRQLAPDEEPPLIDTVREAATRKSREKREFDERYAHSRTGASTVEREMDKDGKTMRDVEYFVPKMTGENAADINYGTPGRKRKSRNRNPMKMWQKATITSVCLFMSFMLFMGMGLSAMLNRMNFVTSAESQKNSTAARGSSGGMGNLAINTAADQAAAAEMAGIDDTDIELPDAVMFDADIENVLLVGSDRRSKSEDGRSDAMMLLTIDRKHKKIKMTSFLRDLYIKIPGKYGTKLNSAYSVGGVDLLKQTIEANLGISVDKYIIVDFNAFKTVVNKIGKLNGKGGIKITVTASEAKYMCSHEKYGLFPRFSKGKGTYYMNGAEALNYARIRKIDSDFGRTKRQRKVLTEIITELKDVGYMDLISIAYSCLEYVTTDFTKAELVGLVTEAADIMNYETKQISIPIKGSYSIQHMSNGNEVLAANLNVNSKKLAAFIYDDDMTYEGNEKEIKGIYLPDLKGIANSNVTTKSKTTTTEAGETTATTAGDAKSTTAAKDAKSTTAAGTKSTTAAKDSKSTTAAKSTTKSTTAKSTTKSTTAATTKKAG